MTMKKRGLGRGLDVLIKSRVVEPRRDAEIVTLDIDALSPNAHQPRHHFRRDRPGGTGRIHQGPRADSTRAGSLTETAGKYEIVAGERRWRASKMAGLARLDCIVRPMDDYEAWPSPTIEKFAARA